MNHESYCKPEFVDSDVPLVFLDIDGVLNTHEDNIRIGHRIDQSIIPWLNAIIGRTGCKIVISSAWRYMIFGGSMNVVCFENMMRVNGFSHENCVIGHTCSDELIIGRATQISDWRSRHSHHGLYVVIDDSSCFPHRQVVTNPHVGLTEVLAYHAIDLLTDRRMR